MTSLLPETLPMPARGKSFLTRRLRFFFGRTVLFFTVFSATLSALPPSSGAQSRLESETPAESSTRDSVSTAEEKSKAAPFLVSPREQREKLFPDARDAVEPLDKKPETTGDNRLRARPIPIDPFNCQRSFTLRGKTYPCDSLLHRDGERLRPLFEGIPDALESLDRYQTNRKKMRWTAYVSSIGILTAIIASLSGPTRDPQRKWTPQGIVMLSGATLSLGSFTYGFILGKTNESNLKNAVSAYNQVHPEEPIEIQVSKTFLF